MEGSEAPAAGRECDGTAEGGGTDVSVGSAWMPGAGS